MRETDRSGFFSTLIKNLDLLVLGAACVFIIWWFRLYFTGDPIAAVDLPGHIAATERLRRHLLSLGLSFYDPLWFTGWPAFHFYAPLGHIVLALVSFPLSLISNEPVRLAAHVILVFGCALLPFAVYYAALPLARPLAEKAELSLSERLVLASAVSALTFWFINHDNQWYGIGAASVMNVGLFSQVFGWHFMLLHLGSLWRVLSGGGRKIRTLCALFFGALLLSHTMTASFDLFFVLMSFLWFGRFRWPILRIHLIGFALSAIWLLPMLIYSGEYTALDIYRPTGDFLELFFRYPLHALIQELKSIEAGQYKSLEWINFVVVALSLVLICSAAARRSQLLISAAVFNCLALVVFSSGFVATSVPLGFHYYRFMAYLFLLQLTVLAPIPLAVLSESRRWFKGIEPSLAAAVLCGIAVACFVNTALLPHYERSKIAANSGKKHLATEQQILDYFAHEPQKGRVFFEYFDNYDRFTFLSCHYIESRLFKETGFETLNGLFIQSSIAYRMPVVSVNLLGGRTYNTPLLFTDRAQLSDQIKVQQLRELGVTHIVGSTPKLLGRLQPFLVAPPIEIKPYFIAKIGEPVPMTTSVSKVVLGYQDLKGNIPFKFVEYYFWAHDYFTKNFELLEIKPDMEIPAEVQGLLVNAKFEDFDPRRYRTSGEPAKNIPVERIDYQHIETLDHYGVRYQHNVELDDYNDVEAFFDNTLRLADRLAVFARPPFTPPAAEKKFTLTWDDGFQGMQLTNLVPGELVRINYSYFPYWSSSDGEVIRGSGERLFFLPHQSSAHLSYSRLKAPSTWLACALTLFAAIVLVLDWRRPE